MRSGLVISKRRMVDYCLAKGNDTRVFNIGTPEEPDLRTPFFRFRQVNVTGQNPNGVLDIRSNIIQDGEVLNSNIQRFNGIISIYIGDNKQRSEYPSGELELHLKLPKWQRYLVRALNWRYGTSYDTSYGISYLDISKLGEVLGILTLDDNVQRISTLNLKNNHKLSSVAIQRHNIDSIDISDNLSLVSFNIIGDSSGHVENLIINEEEYSELTSLSLGNNSFTDIPDIDAPNLTSLTVSNNLINSPDFSNKTYKNITALNIAYNPLGSEGIDLSDLTELSVLNIERCSLTELDLSNNLKLKEINLQSSNSFETNGNNFSGGGLTFQDLYVLTELTDFNALKTRLNNISGQLLDFSYWPLLRMFSVGGSVTGGFINLESSILTRFSFFENTISGTIDGSKVPNLTYLRLNQTSNIDVINWDSLTKLNTFIFYNVTNPNITTIDLSNVTNNITMSPQFVNNIYVEEFNLPNYQINSEVTLNISGNTSLNTITNLNTISRNNTSVHILNNNFSSLDTSKDSESCFNNCTVLALGGANDTYTSTEVYNFRKNNLITLHIRGSVFQTSGNIGTDTCALATFIDIAGDANLSFTTIGGFGSTMRRFYIRPNIASGLATDGDQISDLIIYLSVKNWTTSGNITLGTDTYSFGILDLRGNCATPTPSTELTIAISLLESKGVTVLLN